MIQRRFVLAGLASAAASPLVFAQADKPAIRIVVGFPPGGSADVLARLVAEKMRDALGGQNLVVDNKPGAAGRIAIDQLKAAAPDGQTLIIMPSGPLVLFPHVFKKLNYDPFKDFTPISQLAGIQFAITSGPRTGVRNVPEMIAKSKADPTSATYATSGNGTLPHFLGLMINDSASIQLEHIPFQGGAPAMNALVGGHVGYAIDVVSEALEQHRAGKVRIIAVTGAQRAPQVPDVPTLREQGVPMDAGAWFAMAGPAGLPRDVVTRLHAAVATVMKDKALLERFNALGFDPIGSTPEQMLTVQRADLAKWEKPIKASGFQAD